MNNENIILTKLYSLFQLLHIITYFFISVRLCLYNVEWRVEYKSLITLSPRQKN